VVDFTVIYFQIPSMGQDSKGKAVRTFTDALTRMGRVQPAKGGGQGQAVGPQGYDTTKTDAMQAFIYKDCSAVAVGWRATVKGVLYDVTGAAQWPQHFECYLVPVQGA
jgi:hypothetical protein